MTAKKKRPKRPGPPAMGLGRPFSLRLTADQEEEASRLIKGKTFGGKGEFVRFAVDFFLTQGGKLPPKSLRFLA